MIDELNVRKWSSAASTFGETMNGNENALRSAIPSENLEPGLAHSFCCEQIHES